jgi:hypothetical protein
VSNPRTPPACDDPGIRLPRSYQPNSKTRMFITNSLDQRMFLAVQCFELKPRDMSKRGDTSSQHALFFLRWLGCFPESFLNGSDAERRTKTSLPKASSDERLGWDLHQLYEAVNVRRQELQMTWPELASVLHCTPSQIVLLTVRFAIGMNLAMRIVHWLERPADDFIYRAQW